MTDIIEECARAAYERQPSVRLDNAGKWQPIPWDGITQHQRGRYVAGAIDWFRTAAELGALGPIGLDAIKAAEERRK